MAMEDPRYARFYKLLKRQPQQLTSAEAREVQVVCERMMEYVRDGKTRKRWQDVALQYSKIAGDADESAAP